jgi:hypothetical protein
MSVERKELAKRAEALHDVALELQGAFLDLHEDLEDDGDRALGRASRHLDNADKAIDRLRKGWGELAQSLRGMTLDKAIQSLIEARERVGGDAPLLMADKQPVRSLNFGMTDDGEGVIVSDVV